MNKRQATESQKQVLVTIREYGQPMSAAAVGRKCGKTKKPAQWASEKLWAMSTRGYAKRVPDPDRMYHIRRGWLWTLTDKGVALIGGAG